MRSAGEDRIKEILDANRGAALNNIFTGTEGYFYIASAGSAVAAVLSWSVNHSILWCSIHSILSWLYVIYYGIRY
jgi:hypothetical protein